MTANSIKISFILPCYNVQEYVRECLDSLVKIQAFLPCQIICVNDGSKDRTLEILKSYENVLNNFCIIDQKNKGLSGARNTGIPHAVGEWVCFVDSDDILDVEGFSALKSFLDISFSQIICAEYTDLFGDRVKRVESPIPEIKEISGLNFLKEYYFSTPLSMVWRYIFRREFLLTNHLEFTPNIYFEDMDFTPRALIKANKVEYLKIGIYYYRQREASIMSSNFTSKKFIDSLKVAFNNLDLIIKEPSAKNVMKKSARYVMLRAISLFKPSKKELYSEEYDRLLAIVKRVKDISLLTLLILYKQLPNVTHTLFKKVRHLKSLR